MSKRAFKDSILFVAGFVVLVIGISLALIWWPELTRIFKGVSGVFLAITGLFMMYSAKK